MISYIEAVQLIDKEFSTLQLETEHVKLEDALNRTIAEDVIADINLPSFDNSAVDGIAIKFEDNKSEWKINDEISAGNYSDVSSGEAVLIMTGAMIPPQFDTIIPLEDYNIKDNIAKLKDGLQIKFGTNIRKKASDINIEETVLKKGSLITPRNIAAIAACGTSLLKVYKKLKLGVLATGDELISVDEKPTLDKIRVSNNYGLTSAVETCHQTGINFGFINDDFDATKTKIWELLNSELDIVITTGGVSVGKYDFVKKVFSELGVEEIFWKAFIKPGKPAYFGKHVKDGKTKLVFGLPGNPVSCMVNFDVYIKPCIIKKFNLSPQIRIKAALLNDVRKKDAKRHFVKGTLSREDDKYLVTTMNSQSSGNLVGFSQSNCLVELDEEIRNPKSGDMVECIMI